MCLLFFQLVQKLAESMTQLEEKKKSKKGISKSEYNKVEKEVRKLQNDLLVVSDCTCI